MTAAAHATSVAGRLQAVRSRVRLACERVGRDPREVTLIGVTKGQPAAAIVEAAAGGLADFGENYVQEAVAKLDELTGQLAPLPHFHFIGHLQTNKARQVAGRFDLIHGVDSIRLVDALAAAANGSPVRMMLQVNIGEEPSKGGVSPTALPTLVAYAISQPGVELAGLMAIPPAVPEPDRARPYFRTMRQLAAELGLSALSMGMTGDFEVAIEEGATHIRVGRAIFGERTR